MATDRTLQTAIIEQLPVADLLLDPHNPRLSSVEAGETQKTILKTLFKTMELDELALSISENGFFGVECLYVIEAQTEKLGPKGKYVVIEGNRRLATVKLLLDDALRSELRATEFPSLTGPQRKQLSTLPVIKCKSRDDIWQFLGFRHINGVKEWDAFSKAQYIAQVHERLGVPLTQIASNIGDRHKTVARLYWGYVVLRQAEKFGFSKDDITRNRFYFSHLYTAVGYPEFQAFLGTTEAKLDRPNPIPTTKKTELSQLMLWLYGSKDKGVAPVVVRQNPDLNSLRDVVGNRQAREALISGRSLKAALNVAIGDARRFENAVFTALEALKEAYGLVPTGYKKGDSELNRAIGDIKEIADEMVAKIK